MKKNASIFLKGILTKWESGKYTSGSRPSCFNSAENLKRKSSKTFDQISGLKKLFFKHVKKADD